MKRNQVYPDFFIIYGMMQDVYKRQFTYSKEKEVTQTMIDNCDILVGNPGKHVELNRPNLKAILLNSCLLYTSANNFF